MKAEVISIILKSVLSGKSINELIGGVKDAVIDEISETSMKHIEDLVDKSRDKLKDVLSEENLEKLHISNTDYVKAEIKDILVHVKIDNELLERCQYNVEELKDFLWEYYAVRHDNIEMGRDVQKGINAVSNILMDLFYKSEEFTPTLLLAINRNVNTINRKLDNTYEILQKVSDKEDKIYEAVSVSYDVQNKQRNTEQKPYNKAAEYADVWDKNMFLNNFDKWDEKAGTNVKLSDVYRKEFLPHFIWGNNKDESAELKSLLYEYIVDKTDNKMLLILGQPGIGKSTLITWILANIKIEQDDILVYKFSIDLKNIDWQKADAYTDILEELDLSYDKLNGKTLILDGFDEINVGNNNRERVLNLIYWGLVGNKEIKKFSLIITCRENYIPQYEILQCKYIILQPWDSSQIRRFCKRFGEQTKNIVSDETINNIIAIRKVLGIPLILYMVLALDIRIENERSIVDVYDKVFAIEGGIYDRCRFAEPHRIEKIKRQIHQISREMAIHIFENDPDGEKISMKEYDKICDTVMSDQMQKEDVLIGNYFMKVKHSEKTESDKLCFIHRTIYEYFVVETIYESIKDVLVSPSYDDQIIFIENIIKYLKKGRIDYTIGEFLKYKMLKAYNCMKAYKKNNFWKWLETVVEKMMEKGMLCYIEKDMKKFDYVIEHETICFCNIMHLLSLLSEVYPPEKYLLSTVNGELVKSYMQLLKGLNQPDNKKLTYDIVMRRTDFKRSNLSCAELQGSGLSGSYLTGQNLNFACLVGADMEGAIMENAYLIYSDCKYAVLKKANLENAILRYADLENANLCYANLRNADFTGANFFDASIENAILNGAYLEDSIWAENDICAVLHELQTAEFEHIKIMKNDTKEITRIGRDILFGFLEI